MTTPEDSAAVTPEIADYASASDETRRVIDGLDYVMTYCANQDADAHVLAISAAIDRLIVLDNARQDRLRQWDAQDLNDSLKSHPRELALRQDAARGNFRHQQEEDGA